MRTVSSPSEAARFCSSERREQDILPPLAAKSILVGDGDRVANGDRGPGLSTDARLALRLLSLVVWVAGAACAPGVADGGPRSRAGAIIGGTADTTHESVLALVQYVTPTTGYACSGTSISQNGTSVFLLTAAHCVVQHDATFQIVQPMTIASPTVLTVVPGPDWQTSLAQGRKFSVAAVAMAPGYDGATDSPNDLAVVRFVTSTPSMPVIPILEPADDALAIGSTLTLVGYGVTTVGTQNSTRQTIDRPVDSLNAQHLYYLQNDMKGQCSGDSGGPALARVGGTERVAGVISYGVDIPSINLVCSLQAASVRVSSLASFIHSIVGSGTPPDAGTAADAARPPDAGSGTEAGSSSDGSSADVSPPPPTCGKVTDSRPACAACIASRCCTEAAVCGADPLCLGCGANPLPSCQAYPPSAILTACLATCSGNPCGVTPLDAGGSPSDAGSTDGRVTDAVGPDAAKAADAGGGGDAAPPPDSATDGARPASDGPNPESPPALDAGGANRDAAPGSDANTNEPPAGTSGCSCAVGERSDRNPMGRPIWEMDMGHARRPSGRPARSAAASRTCCAARAPLICERWRANAVSWKERGQSTVAEPLFACWQRSSRAVAQVRPPSTS